MAETQLQEQLQYSFLEERTFSQFSNTVEFADLLRCEAKWRPNQQVGFSQYTVVAKFDKSCKAKEHSMNQKKVP